jgi:uncharacterized protein YjbJ (UPF0337 family)
MQPLSQNLAELSAQAKKAEDRVAKAQSETKERLEQQRDEARARAEQALSKVSERVNEAKGEARTRFEALQAKVNADFDNLKQRSAERREKFESWQANNYADDKEDDAVAAIDYAIAATRLAESQTLDAIAARAEADVRAEHVELSQPTA